MRKGKQRNSLNFAGVVLLTVAVSGVPLAAPTSSAASAPAARPTTFDDLFAAVAERVPTFGGAYIDEGAQTLLIWTTDLSQAIATAAKQALIDVLGDESLAALRPAARQARYRFPELKQWHDRMMPEVFAIEGVVLTDIDELRNLLTVGVQSLALYRAHVEARLIDLGIPLDAVVLEETQPPKPSSSLRTRHRPVLGGLRIENSTLGECTLGFIAVRAGTRGFVTNSHCTNVQGGVEGTVFGQPSTTPVTDVIGTESVDPTYFTGENCPPGRRCRYSDSAFVTLNSLTASDQGKVALTRPLGSIAWNGTDKFRITRETEPLAGQGVAKVGSETGRTIGTVKRTCVNGAVERSDIVFLCQFTADYTSELGDSGAPIIRSEGGETFDVSLKGIHFGATASERFFSSIANIQLAGVELGAVSTCAPGFSC